MLTFCYRSVKGARLCSPRVKQTILFTPQFSQTGLPASHACCSLARTNVIDDAARQVSAVPKKLPGDAVFNRWWEVDRQNDINRNARAIQRRQLRAYLRERLRKANVAIIGEAIGYRGDHSVTRFS